MPENKSPFHFKQENTQDTQPLEAIVPEEFNDTLPPETPPSVPSEDKPFYKKWWFWLIVGLIVLFTLLMIPSSQKTSTEATTATTTTVTQTATTTTTVRTYTMDELTVRKDEENGGWYAYAGDEKALSYTGLAKNDLGTWYVVNGKVDFDKNGTETFDGKEYVITGGKAEEKTTTTQRATDSSGVSLEMKELMDSYEEFVDEYCEFMEDYDSSSSWAVLAKSSSMLAKYSDWLEKLDNMNEDDWSYKDWAYYEEVTLRCAAKLSKVTASLY